MARAAEARRTAPRPRPEADHPASRPAPRRRPVARPDAVARARLTRLFFVFVICLTVLAVGRVALSFAVVQKSLQTDAVKTEQRRLESENADLAAQVTQLGAGSRIRQIAEHQLGLVPADRPIYLTVPKKGAETTASDARR